MQHKVFIASVFGRGAWMAADLSSKKMNVTFVDLSQLMGLWPKEDIIGPFGFFKSDELDSSYLERIYAEDPMISLDCGFTVLTSQGPFEMKGPLSLYQKEYFPEEVLLKISRVFSCVQVDNYLESTKKNLDLSLNYQLPTYLKTGGDRLQEWFKNRGVNYLTDTKLLDVTFDSNKKFKGVELLGPSEKGFSFFDSMIWTLTEEETRFAFDKISNKIFSEKIEEPEWSWLRYRVQLQGADELKVLPHQFLMIQDLNAPWTHVNFVIVKRTAAEDSFDFWVLLPTHQRFNKSYLKHWGDEVLKVISDRIVGVQTQIQSYPQEYYYTFEELGPSRFPLFKKKRKSKRGDSNFYFESPDCWDFYVLNDRFKSQKNIVDQINLKWNEHLQKLEKKRRKN